MRVDFDMSRCQKVDKVTQNDNKSWTMLDIGVLTFFTEPVLL